MQFTLSTSKAAKFGPRIGNVLLKRSSGPEHRLSFETPNLLTSTSRGVIPHLSRDQRNRTQAIRWVNVPFETFVERNPPVPTLQRGKQPLHTFLGFKPTQHVLAMSLRDPADGRDMPPNGNNHVSVYCLRGVRKVSPSEWRSHVLACQPDVVVALSDIPFTNPPYSQKRLTKSIDRSTSWLIDLLRPIVPESNSGNGNTDRLNVLVHMAGGTNISARRAFSDGLVEMLDGKEAEQVAPLHSLDEGVIGYDFDLVPLRVALEASMKKAEDPGTLDSQNQLNDLVNSTIEQNSHRSSYQRYISTQDLIPLINASLAPLPTFKLRVVNTAYSPHEMLRLIQTIGVDLFDAHYAQRAGDIGIALDFVFPAPTRNSFDTADANRGNGNDVSVPSPSPPGLRDNGKRDLGHNLYDTCYAFDFSHLASNPSPASLSTNDDPNTLHATPTCPCPACSPVSPTSRICHGPPELEAEPPSPETNRPPFTRAYLHHLLHTHEMSAHSLLVMHNLSVLDAFFGGIRRVIASSEGTFAHEVERFVATYDEDLKVFDEAVTEWRDVDLARGKGRLAREKVKLELNGDSGFAEF
ncbi:hypothetical protein AX17_005384 [Amanita inopinata Kibby_2008]|nr:hypothetical protein AX17_005384 [Amanita inopinata Kibby_2008]